MMHCRTKVKYHQILSGLLCYIAGMLLVCFYPMSSKPNLAGPLIWISLPLAFQAIIFLLNYFDVHVYHLPFKRRYFPTSLIIHLFFALIGAAWFYQNAMVQFKKTSAIPKHLQTLKLSGEIVSLPRIDPQKTQFIFQTDTLRISLSDYRHQFQFHAGEHWTLKVRLKPIHGRLNPGGMDLEKWAFYQKISATGYVMKSPFNHREATWSYHVRHLREIIRARLYQTLDHPMMGILLALVIGDRSQLSPELWEYFKQTGTSHLVAISGLHIGLIAGFIFFIVQGLWRLSPKLCHGLPTRKAGLIASLFAALSYSLLAGMSLPTQRAFIMLACATLFFCGNRAVGLWMPYLLAMAISLTLEPLVLLSSGFYLSFGAVGILVYGLNHQYRAYPRWQNTLRPQILMSIGMIPMNFYLFKQLSGVGLIANIIAIPWLGMVILPAALIGTLLVFIAPSLASSMLSMVCGQLEYFVAYLAYLSHFEAAIWQYNPPFGVALLSCIGVFLLISPRGLRHLGVIMLLPLFFPISHKLPQNTFDFALLDVGQGLATVIHTRHHTLIYDTGRGFNRFYNMGRQVVIPYLNEQHLFKIDTLVVSHPDNDHIGGARALLEHYSIKTLYESALNRLKPYHETLCQQGIHWVWDGVQFEFLYPDSSVLNNRGLLTNNQSCVLRVQTKNHRLLLTGDIEKEAEAHLIHSGQNLKAQWLVVPHHGSQTSSSVSFLKAVQPDIGFIGAGFLNAYRLPSKRILKRYQKMGVDLYNTAHCGAILAHAADVPTVTCYRAVHPRFWRAHFGIHQNAFRELRNMAD